MTSRRLPGGPHWPRLLLAVWVVATAVLTLRPGTERDRPVPFTCFPCGERGSADAVLNAVLFAPPGVLLASMGVGVAPVAIGAALGSAGIEAAQTVLPGRFPTAADIVFNTLGAILGALLWRSVRRRSLTTGRWSSAILGGLLFTAYLSAPVAPEGDLFGQYTPDLGGFATYDGVVASAEVAGVAVPPGRTPDPEPLREALRVGGPVRVHFDAGSAGAEWAPLFAIFSDDRALGVFTAVRGADLFVRRRTRGTALRFQSPAVIYPDALVGLSPGEPARVEVVDRADTGCIRVGARQTCGFGTTPLDGWTFLVGGPSLSPMSGRVLSILWLGIPLLALVAAPGSPRARWVGFGAVLLAIALVPRVSPLASAAWVDVGLVALVGWIGGVGVVRLTRHSARERAPVP